MKKSDWWVFFGLFLAWGPSFLWIKIGVQEISPFLLVLFRLFFGAAGLLIVAFYQKIKWPKNLKTYVHLAIIGLINIAIPFVLISWGETQIDSGLASVMNGTVPIFSVVLAHFFLEDDRLTWRKAIGVIIGFFGVIVIVFKDIELGVSNSVMGQLAVLGAAFSYAVSAVVIRKTTKGINTTIQSLVPLIFAEISVGLFMLLSGLPFSFPNLAITWVALIWLGIIGSCVAYLLYFTLIHNVGPSRATMVTFTFPVLGVVLGTSILGEELSLQLALGCILVVFSIWLVNQNQNLNKLSG